MTREEAIKDYIMPALKRTWRDDRCIEIISAIEQEPCKMTAEEYRQRMIQAFHNADTDELIAVCVLPTEKEFEHLEWLLKNHYKKTSCVDAISRQAVLDAIDVKAWEFCDYLISKNRNDEQKPVSHFADNLRECVREELPSVNPQQKTGHWIRWYEQKENDWVVENIPHCKCSECGKEYDPHSSKFIKYCNECGAKMQESEEV